MQYADLAKCAGVPPAQRVRDVREDFPALAQLVHGKPLTYLDSAATSIKPSAVIEAVESVYAVDCGNIHRAVHTLSERATERYEGARARIARGIGAAMPAEVVFTRGATEGINLVAASFLPTVAKPDAEVLVTSWEHHANIVPWQQAAARLGLHLRVARLPIDRAPVADDVLRYVNEKTCFVAFTELSNVFGVRLPTREIVHALNARGIASLVDGCQGVVHGGVDVAALGADFYVFSGHKLYGPTGIGVLYGRYERLAAMGPYQTGGDMIETVSFETTTFAPPPARFEAGTPHIAGAIGLAAAFDYLEAHPAERTASETLAQDFEAALAEEGGIVLLGPRPSHTGIFPFVCPWGHALDIATFLDLEGVAVRVGHHCAQPLMAELGVTSTLRVSLGIYSSSSDLDRLLSALRSVRQRLA